MQLSPLVLEVITKTTGMTASDAQFEAALQAVQTGRAIIYGQGDAAKVAIDSDSTPGLKYRFGVNEPCCCKAGQHNRMCWHRLAADMLATQQADTNAENRAKRAAAQVRTQTARPAVAGANALDELFD